MKARTALTLAWTGCVAAVIAPAFAATPVADGASRTAGCDRFASPRGSDRGRQRGSRSRPFRSVRRLARSLRRGETGCLYPGSYRHGRPVLLKRPQTALRGLAGGRVRVDGAIWVQGSARGASVSKLRLTASDPVHDIPLKVLADDVRVTRNAITGSTSTICVLVGSHRLARWTRIERNRISRCGSTGKFDHLIYLEQTLHARVRNNLLTANAGGWAVHMYPDADQTVVERNTIDGNQGGVIFAGDGLGSTSDGNVVRFNVITFSSPRWNIEGSWSGGPAGRGNRAHDNCLFTEGPAAPAGIAEPDGFTADRNVAVAASPYIARPMGDYRLAPTSGCTVPTGAR